MDGIVQYIAMLFIGASVLTCAVSYYENSAAENKIKNMETLVFTRDYLNTRISVQESHLMLQEVEKHIDSLNNIK